MRREARLAASPRLPNGFVVRRDDGRGCSYHPLDVDNDLNCPDEEQHEELESDPNLATPEAHDDDHFDDEHREAEGVGHPDAEPDDPASGGGTVGQEGEQSQVGTEDAEHEDLAEPERVVALAQPSATHLN